jgi:hypothetical protein
MKRRTDLESTVRDEELGIDRLMCRSCRQMVAASRDGRGCKKCSWWVSWIDDDHPEM